MRIDRILWIGVTLLIWACSRAPSDDAAPRVRSTGGRWTEPLTNPLPAPSFFGLSGGKAGSERDGLRGIADQAALDLLRGRLDRAVSRLEAATVEAPDDAGLWNDLAAVHLTAPGDPQHLFAAWEAATRALALDPGFPEALFNRATILQRLFLKTQAIAGWEEYLRIDRGSLWSAEAEARQAELSAPSEEERWQAERDLLGKAARSDDDETLLKVVARYPQFARTFAEENLLGKWARAVADHRWEDATEALVTARGIGKALARYSGDRLLIESVEVIDAAAGEANRDPLVAGHLAYQDGLERMRQNPEEAQARLEQAYERLDRTGSPLALWALFQLGHRHFLDRQPEKALVRLERLCRLVDGKPFKSLAGRAWWLKGTTFLYLARYSEALVAFQRARTLFEETGERSNLAGIHTLLARTLGTLGDSPGAWRNRLEALRQTAAGGSTDRARVAYTEAAWALREENRLDLAAAFQEEAVNAARRLANPGQMATALHMRAAIHHRRGENEEAFADLQAARSQLPGVADPASRENLRYELSLIESQILMGSDPAAALGAIDVALALGKDRFFIPSLLVERSRAHLLLSDPLAAENDLQLAIREIEDQRGSIDEALKRVSYLDRARQAYEDLVDLEVTNGRGNEATLASAERARARVLFDWISALPEDLPARREPLPASARLRPVATLRQALRDDVAVEYMVQESRTLAWVVRQEGVELVVLPVSTDDLSGPIAEWRELLKSDRQSGEDRLASALYDALVRPLLLFLRPDEAVVFLPDRFLHGLPFSALLDRTTGRRLVEDRVTSVAPSLNVLAACREQVRRAPLPVDPLLLAFSDPLFDRSLFNLPSLDAANQEATEAGALYRLARIISGSEATPSRLLEEAGRYDIVHYIGHAQLSRENPLLSSLILAPDSETRSSGVLYAHQLLGKRLPRTRLLLLSACSTGVGPDSPTEGALSLAAPFLAAGVSGVVASLWDVKDRPSSTFMITFHRYLRQGLSPARALRSARLDLIASGDRSLVRPGSWAAFELICGW